MFSFFRQPSSKEAQSFSHDDNDDNESPTMMSTKSVGTENNKNGARDESDDGPPPLLTLSPQNLPGAGVRDNKVKDDDARSEASSVAPSVMSSATRQGGKAPLPLTKQKSVAGFFGFFTRKQEEVVKEDEVSGDDIPDGGNSPEYEDVNRIDPDEWNPVIDYYEILGLQNKHFKQGETDPRFVSTEEIDNGYKKMSERWDPGHDRNFGDKIASENFKKVKEAYDVLSSPQKRRWYNIKGDPEDITRHKDDDGLHPDDHVEPAPLGGIPMVFNAVFGKLVQKLKRDDEEVDEMDGIFEEKDEVPEKICLLAYKLIDEGWLLEKPELDNPEVDEDEDEVDTTVADTQKDSTATDTAISGEEESKDKEGGDVEAKGGQIEVNAAEISNAESSSEMKLVIEAKDETHTTPGKSVKIIDTVKSAKSPQKTKAEKSKKREKKPLTEDEKDERKKDSWVEPIRWCEPFHDVALRQHPRFARLYVNEEHSLQGFIIMIRSETRGSFSFTIFDDEKNIVCLQHAARTRDNRFTESAYYSTHFETFKMGDIPIERDTDEIFTKLNKFGRTENEKLEAGRYLICIWGTNFIGYTAFNVNVVPFQVEHKRIIKKLKDCDRVVGAAKSDLSELHGRYSEIKEKYYSVLKEVEDCDADIEKMIKKREKYYNKIYDQSYAPWIEKEEIVEAETSHAQEAATAAAIAASAAANEAAASAAGGMQAIFKKASALATFVITRKMPVGEEAEKMKQAALVDAQEKEDEAKLNEKVGDQFELLKQKSGLGLLERQPSKRRKSLSSRSVDSNDDAVKI